MTETVGREIFESAYAEGTPDWVIGQAQPAVVELEQAGRITGRVLDAGCGAGEHTIHLAERGHDVLGIDFSDGAIALARRIAAERGVAATFRVADALALGDGAAGGDLGAPFDTVVDSALFHVFGAADRRRYADALHRVTRTGATVHLVALAETEEPGFGPRISDSAIREAFTDGWTVDELTAHRYRAVAHSQEHADGLGVRPGELVDLPAWLARIRRH
ncbi:cyclopropane fatty-acyl-phospholipid synthase-like methyltransferase [Prauserella sediminis]|uniref:Cyclopropane fatty-acyl-phospholipid synthase-like methyltransferase n=1 Tax=Prauserella sediminis TaxID=577680 RepID=A0A839XTL4_9PSEU|nr:class I SAM-dependent methyltransferase [Prauserella sediminis]MBB3665369.1 cyclopropane fatty-acyl-phospholipid synthase-like methyltransferase [Prauserella sediminis]